MNALIVICWYLMVCDNTVLGNKFNNLETVKKAT